MSEELQTYTIHFFTMGKSARIEMTEEDFKFKCATTIRSFLVMGKSEEATRRVLTDRRQWASELEYADGVEREPDTRFEDECLAQLDSGAWKLYFN